MENLVKNKYNHMTTKKRTLLSISGWTGKQEWDLESVILSLSIIFIIVMHFEYI